VPDTECDDAEVMAEAAGLRYCSDADPGIVRLRCGRGFRYLDADRRPIDAATRARIDALVVPPAWTEVWISADPDSHLQATGRDDRDRKQYLYHPRWREVRDEAKFAQLGEFADALTEIRRRVASDLAQGGLGRQRVLAAVVRLLDTSLIRVGNERYAAENETFGATTLEPRHVSRVDGGFRLDFVGKSGVERSLEVCRPELIAVIDDMLRVDEPQLFAYQGETGLIDVTSGHVNEYLAAVAGPGISAKTFRTWGATTLAVRHLCVETDPEATIDKRCLAAIDAAAEALGNTRAVCRACYVAPTVLASAESGAIEEAWTRSRSGRWRSRAESTTTKVLGKED
jgi:DNA topoisomerase-1